MNRCSTCNNELIAGARFCNICGTPLQGATATPAAPAEAVGLKRTIKPEVRRVPTPRTGQTISGSLMPDASAVESGTPDEVEDSVESTGGDAPQTLPEKAEKHAPGIIRPIVTSSSLRQNTPIPPVYTSPDPLSPLPALPYTPPLSGEKARQTDNARFSRALNSPAPDVPAQENQRHTGGPQSLPMPPGQQSHPSLNNTAARQQNRFNAVAPQTPRPLLDQMPTISPDQQHANGNGVSSTAARQELPLFSPESFAYTSKAAQHWRSSWRDLQNTEAGPAQDVSKGQAEVPAPLANRRDSFLRMRAIRSKQTAEEGEKSFGFWVTLFLMICLIAGLAAYIVYSYLPGTSTAVHVSQPAGAPQPTFAVVGASAQALTFSRGQSLRAHGDHFGANDPIGFLLDSTKPVLASTGSPLSVQSDSQGSFDVTILVGKDWTIGAHVLSATDSRANLSAYMDIQVNLVDTPVAGNNNDLAFSLNRQAIDHLSFTAQLGQSAPAAQRMTFTNISGAPLQWTAAASTPQNLNWLTIVDNDFAGQLAISQPHTMGIMVNPTGLAVSSKPYSGQIVFTINGSVQLTLPVQLTIIDATPEMVFSPNPLVANANANGTCQTGATLTFINLGMTVIHWSANPDLSNIQFVNGNGALTTQGTLQPSDTDGDTAVVTLRCNGVKAGQKYVVHVYANSNQYIEIVQIA